MVHTRNRKTVSQVVCEGKKSSSDVAHGTERLRCGTDTSSRVGQNIVKNLRLKI